MIMSNIVSIYNVSSVSRQAEGWKIFHDHDHHQPLMIVCETSFRIDVNSDGFWMGDSPLAHALPLLLLQGTLAFVACRAIYFVLRPLKQPKFVCYILGGILLGPSILGQKRVMGEILLPPKEKIVLETLAAIGEVLFNFLVAVKVDVSRVLSTNKKAWSIGGASYALPFPILLLLMVGCINYVGGLTQTIFCFGMSTFISASYFPAVANALEEFNLVTSEFGLLASSCAFVHTLILWVLMPLSLVLVQKTLEKSIATAFCFFALALFTFFVVRPTIFWMVKKTPQGEPIREVFVVLTLIGALIMGCLTNIMGLSLSLGAVLFGLIIPEGPPLASILVEKSEAFVYDILMPLWYFRVGIEMNAHSIYNWKAFLIFHCVLLVAYVAKFVGVLLASLSFKIRPRHAALLGLVMNCKGAIDVMVFFRWKGGKYLDDQSYFVLVSSALAVTAFATPLVEIFYKPQTLIHDIGYKNPPNNPQGLRAIQNTPRNSKFPIICCIHNEENVRGIITLLEASNPTETSPICAYVIHLMDILGRAVPLVIPYNKHNLRQYKWLLSSTSFSFEHIMRALTNYSENSVGPITIHPFTIIAPYQNMHENISKLAQDNHVPLIIVPHHENQRATQGNRVASSIHALNTNLKNNAPCTVGVLVDRPFRTNTTTSSGHYFSCDVAIIFIGGQDDREALAYAAQMSHHPNVSITVIRVISLNKIKDHADDNDSEYVRMQRMLDEDVYARFKKENAGNACVVCWEFLVDDILRVVDPIRSSGRHYDLVMVGQRHFEVDNFDNKEMPAFATNEDLGVVGDIIYASFDLYGGWSSLLVLKHCGDCI